jgi:hypothetical protein
MQLADILIVAGVTVGALGVASIVSIVAFSCIIYNLIDRDADARD